MPAPTPPTIGVEFRGGPYAGQTLNMCEPLRDTVVVLDPTSLPSVGFGPIQPDPVLPELVDARRVTYRLESYYNSATFEVGHVYVADPPPRPTPADDEADEVLGLRMAIASAAASEWARLRQVATADRDLPLVTDPPPPTVDVAQRLRARLADAVDRAYRAGRISGGRVYAQPQGQVRNPAGPRCPACDGPLGASPSDNFCDDVCQRAFYAKTSDPLPSNPDPWNTWADPAPYGDNSIRADECVEGQRRARATDQGVDMLDAIVAAFGVPADLIFRFQGDVTRARTGLAALRAQFDQVQDARLEDLREVVERLSDLGAEPHNREGDRCAATPDAAANPPSSTEPSSTGTDAPPEDSPT